jgi:hypothetical protein
MERKTLLYQPSGQAQSRAASQVNAPAGAFGDAGGAMAGLGRDIQSLGGSVAQVGRNLEIKKNLALREDQDKKELGLKLEQQAAALAEQELIDNKAAASGAGYIAAQKGDSALFVQKRQEAHRARLNEEYKWSPPSASKEHADDYNIQVETARLSQWNGHRTQDSRIRTTLRTDSEVGSIGQAFSRVAGQGFQGVMAAHEENVKRGMVLPGVDQGRVDAARRENLMAAMEKNPLPFDVPDEERKKIHDWAIDAGMTGAFAASYVKKNEPKLTVAQFNDNFSEIESKGISDPAILNDLQAQADYLHKSGQITTQQKYTVVPRVGLSIDIRSGSQSPVGLTKDRYDEVMLNENTQDPEAIRKMFGPVAKDFDVEDLKKYRDLAVASAKEFKNNVDNHPEFFAEKRTVEAGTLSRDIMNTVNAHLQSNDDGPAPIQGMLDKYNALVAGSLKSAGYPAEPGRKFVPPEFLKMLSASSSIGALNTATSSFDPQTLRSLSASAVSQDSKLGAVLTLTSALPNTVYLPGKEQVSPAAKSRSGRFETIKGDLLHLTKVHDNKVRGFEDAYLKQPDRKDAPNGRAAMEDVANLYEAMPASGTGFNLAAFVNGIPAQETTEVTLHDTVSGMATGLGLSAGDTEKLHSQFKDLILRDAASRDSGSPAKRVHDATDAMARRLKDMGLLTYVDENGNSSTMYLPLEGPTNWLQDSMFSRQANQAESINFAEKAYGSAVEGMNMHFSKMLLAERLDGGPPYRKFWYNTLSSKNFSVPGRQGVGPGITDEHVFEWGMGNQLDGMDKNDVRALAHLSGASLVRSSEHGGFVVTVPPGTKSTFFGFIPMSGSSQVVVLKDTKKPFVVTDERMRTMAQYHMQYDSGDILRTARRSSIHYSARQAYDKANPGWTPSLKKDRAKIDRDADRKVVRDELDTIATQQSRFLSP